MISPIINRDTVLISVHQKYAEKIINGEKTIELRKSLPQKVKPGDNLIIYVTSPVKKLYAICTIKQFIKSTPDRLKADELSNTGITSKEFDQYYKSSSKAYAIVLENIIDIKHKNIELKTLKTLVPKFLPPQTYYYFNDSVVGFINLKKILFH
ncbi:ASCH domain-containing protein [Nonlabens ulvanivorans]|uniref:Phage protein n=1 Tax=Nonlabens ulvanivorans TaxID=906888 RepID=A0A081DA25_NONUL|nr:ASCH domain-containing protein [Nonlabens ulvanivorans]WOI24147.1 ASCH domain-containing protein [Nonlabens ulvanivorans]GAK75771.1 phage protein [Nonlabens ulvanivorans]